jgi:hypothetical protein
VYEILYDYSFKVIYRWMTHDASKGSLFILSFFCFGCNLLVKFRSQMAGDYLQMGVSRSDAAIAIYSIENIGGILDKNVSPFSRSYNKINAFMGQRLLYIEIYNFRSTLQRKKKHKNQ